MLGILYHGTKLEANCRNSVLNHSAEEKKQLGILFRGSKIVENSLNFVPKHVSNENMLSSVFCLLKQDFL
jgi:hypothetical protein